MSDCCLFGTAQTCQTNHTFLDIAMATAHEKQFRAMWAALTDDQRTLIEVEIKDQLQAKEENIDARLNAAREEYRDQLTSTEGQLMTVKEQLKVEQAKLQTATDELAQVQQDAATAKTEAARTHSAKIRELKEDAGALEVQIKDLEKNEQELKDQQGQRQQVVDIGTSTTGQDPPLPQWYGGFGASRKSTFKQPEMYKSSNDLKNYVKCWCNYKRICELTDKVAIQSFYSYLEEDLQVKMGELADREDLPWEEFKELVLKTLGKPTSGSAMRHKLRFLKQGHDESLLDYTEKLEKLANQAFTEDQQAARDRALKDALASGLRDDLTAIEIIRNEDWSYKEALDFALQKEQSVMARKEMNNGYGSFGHERTSIKMNQSPESCGINLVEEGFQQPQGQGSVDTNVYQYVWCYNCNNEVQFTTTSPCVDVLEEAYM